MKGATKNSHETCPFFIDHPRFCDFSQLFMVGRIGNHVLVAHHAVSEHCSPTIKVTTLYPGASADVIARPLQRRLSRLSTVWKAWNMSAPVHRQWTAYDHRHLQIGAMLITTCCSPKRASRIRLRACLRSQLQGVQVRRRSMTSCWPYTPIRRMVPVRLNTFELHDPHRMKCSTARLSQTFYCSLPAAIQHTCGDRHRARSAARISVALMFVRGRLIRSIQITHGYCRRRTIESCDTGQSSNFIPDVDHVIRNVLRRTGTIRRIGVYGQQEVIDSSSLPARLEAELLSKRAKRILDARFG